MAYLEEYADRVRDVLRSTNQVIEKKMFGSLGFMVNGHLAVGVGDGSDGSVLMVRVGIDAEETALEKSGASTTIMRNRPMHGWIDLTPEAIATDEQIQTWVNMALAYVNTLPPK